MESIQSEILIGILQLCLLPIIFLVTCTTKMKSKKMAKSTTPPNKANGKKKENKKEENGNHKVYLKMIRRLERKSPPSLRENKKQDQFEDNSGECLSPPRNLFDNRNRIKTAKETQYYTIASSTEKLLATNAISVENTLYVPRNLASIREEPELESYEGKLIDGEIFVSLNGSRDSIDVGSDESFPWPTSSDITEFRRKRHQLMSEFEKEKRERRNHRRAKGLSSKSSSSSSSTSCASSKTACLLSDKQIPQIRAAPIFKCEKVEDLAQHSCSTQRTSTVTD